MLWKLILLLTVVPIAELVVLLQVHHWLASQWGTAVGLVVTVGTIAVTGVTGAFLARQQGFGVVQKIRKKAESGGLPGPELVDGVMVLMGAGFLLTPGFLTDALGFSLLLPFTRVLYRERLIRWFREKIERGEFRIHTFGGGGGTANNDEVVDIGPSGPKSAGSTADPDGDRR